MSNDKFTGGVNEGLTGDAGDTLARSLFNPGSGTKGANVEIENDAPYGFLDSDDQITESDFDELVEVAPIKSNAQIWDLGDDEYILKQPILITIEEYPGEDDVIASFPELELFGQGVTESEAMANLKLEILDLYDELTEDDQSQLGKKPKAWLRILNHLIVKAADTE